MPWAGRARPRPRHDRPAGALRATDLFLSSSGLALDALAAVVPPSCRREVERAPDPRLESDAAVLEFPEWRPRRPARHLVPSFRALSPADPGFRFELSVRRGVRWAPWGARASIGPDLFPTLAPREDGIAAEIDELTVTPPSHPLRP